MAKQEDLDKAYMNCAIAMSALSKAERKKVGAIVVSPQGCIIAEAFNGTPKGFNNCCETNEYHDYQDNDDFICVRCGKPFDAVEEVCCLKTKPEVLHAESNSLLKIARSTNSSEGATLYVTCSPCFECAKLIIQAGIRRVVFLEEYRLTDGLDLLKKANIKVEQCLNK